MVAVVSVFSSYHSVLTIFFLGHLIKFIIHKLDSFAIESVIKTMCLGMCFSNNVHIREVTFLV